MLRSWMPSVVDLIQEIVLVLHKYCTERLFEDLKRGAAIFVDLAGSIYALTQPAVKSVFEFVADGLLALHNNGMSYTDEILQRVLGIDG